MTRAFIRRRTPKNKTMVADEVLLGKHLFLARGKRSEVSGNPLGDNYDHVFASHILAKGAYPKFRHYYKNIVLMTYIEHHRWEFEGHKIKDLPEWKWVFQLKDLLKREYYQKK
jgi:hypothetical protein